MTSSELFWPAGKYPFDFVNKAPDGLMETARKRRTKVTLQPSSAFRLVVRSGVQQRGLIGQKDGLILWIGLNDVENIADLAIAFLKLASVSKLDFFAA